MIAVDKTEAPLFNIGNIAFGPISFWIWCAWKWISVSWSSGDIVDDRAVVGGVSVLFGVDVVVDVFVFVLPWYPEANFLTLGFPPAAFEFNPLLSHASFLHSRRVSSSNIQHLAWELISKSTSPMANCIWSFTVRNNGAGLWKAWKWLPAYFLHDTRFRLPCQTFCLYRTISIFFVWEQMSGFCGPAGSRKD